ncbi:Acyl-CoA synthetase (AMP-forming)/AMP-acid ligase II [Mariniphaga anaerophila]|uniref:Acyl-CoA synthetase (AMP-forming)/AMP-acid ligase II n=1 Tax=Mariniphaga anaerophila TaxID=1484053 RepID=A0A1M5BK30_9BACT|nr:AMP-binding protein [Mariniphaga anaerophila]SHF42911.1 Acyl-CoA synthetase (AMP-forming)/AMP-acid ligase II [Mariniphaga anaerophila]
MNVTQYLFENTAEWQKNFILGNKEVISFHELFAQSSRLASYLSATTGSSNNIILVSQNNSFFLVCYLGIMMSGNVCIPLDPTTEQKNFEYIIQKSKADFCFIETRIQQKLKIATPEAITEKTLSQLTAGQSLFSFSEPFNGNLPAQIIFTSGSTGLPKGVVLSHNNIIANTDSILQYLHLTPHDIIEVVLPFFYCYGLSLLHTHLRVGGSMVLNNNFILIGSVLNDINKYKCTGFAGVPSHFQILLRKSKNFRNTNFQSLRYVTQAGGKLHKIFIEEFTDAFPEIDFFVMYGQTEATARLSYLAPNELKNKLGSIGKGIPSVQLKVVNQKGEEVTAGETGEIIAKGKNVMLGYYEEPELTEQTIKNGWLYTGDIGTIDSDGYIYLTARNKEFIKVAGKRVSPKEIEEVIVSFPQVVDCTIKAIQDDITGDAIKAVVVIEEDPGNNITEEKLKSYCAEKLAPHKVPHHIEFSKKININSAGKKVKTLNS